MTELGPILIPCVIGALTCPFCGQSPDLFVEKAIGGDLLHGTPGVCARCGSALVASAVLPFLCRALTVAQLAELPEQTQAWILSACRKVKARNLEG